MSLMWLPKFVFLLLIDSQLSHLQIFDRSGHVILPYFSNNNSCSTLSDPIYFQNYTLLPSSTPALAKAKAEVVILGPGHKCMILYFSMFYPHHSLLLHILTLKITIYPSENDFLVRHARNKSFREIASIYWNCHI